MAGTLGAVPARARQEVQRNLALLDQQVAEANRRLVSSTAAIQGDPNFVNNAVLGPLRDKRTATLNRIATAVQRTGQGRPRLNQFATCTVAAGQAGGGQAGGQVGGGQAGAAAFQQPDAQAQTCLTQTASGAQKFDQARFDQEIAAFKQSQSGNAGAAQQAASTRLSASAADPYVDRTSSRWNHKLRATTRVLRRSSRRPQAGSGGNCTDILIGEAKKALAAFDPAARRYDNGKGQTFPFNQSFPAQTAQAPGNAGDLIRQDLAQVQQIAGNRRRQLGSAATGQFANQCDVDHNNTDNNVISPGVQDGAQHIHDYFANPTTNAGTTAENLLSVDRGVACANTRDLSTYFWPALTRGGQQLRPQSTQLQFRGYTRDVGEVVPMPRGLVLFSGAAKNLDPAKSAAQFSCTNNEAKTSVTFPNCPAGSKLVRVIEEASCWDGVNLDSADHKTHVVFPDAGGGCPAGNPVPLPRLKLRSVYDLHGDLNRQGVIEATFPEALGLPVTDHAAFINMWPTDLMRAGVACINSGRDCGNLAR